MIVLKREHSRKNSLLMIAAALLISIICTVFLFPVPVSAQQDQTDVIPVGTGNDLTWQNTATGYGIYMEDNASLLSEEERARLISESMMPVTEYGNAGFISTTTNNTDTERYAKERYAQLFGSDSGTLLVVDMNRRVIALHSDGEIYRTITRNAADTIMDNVYKKASEGDYFGMASAAYSQILRKLAGGKISQPMKYITNAFIAVIAALLINYLLVRKRSHAFAPSRKEILDALERREEVSNKQSELRSTFKKYSPIVSSSGGGGGRSGGGGGGGGGGSHRF
ncbi:MAG: TPM domain-containing protein [Lachnospiraceae bacterium]|nr:TPM domain-containing protein [Lachnospiraceae bacterium]